MGIWLVLDSVPEIIGFLSALPFFGNDYADNIFGMWITFAILLLVIGFYIIILRLFLFKTNWLIDKLHLDKGFPEENIDLNVPKPAIISVATIVIGGIIFVDGLPLFCSNLFEFFQQKNIFREDPNSGWLIFQFVKTIIGYLLMTNSKTVVGFIDKYTDKERNRIN